MLNRHGADQWIPATLVVTPVIAACAWLAVGGEPGWWLPAGVCMIALLGFIAFFRDPPRNAPGSADGCMVSPADGRVSAVFSQAHHDAVDGPATVVRIFLSVLDVHVNRVPWDGEVLSRAHRPGRYLDVRTPYSAHVNESVLLSLRAAGGQRYGVRLVSGAIARRIVCTLRPGDRATRGERMGLIKFGSTTELIVPADSEVLVREGDRVVGAVTALARLRA
ncbi:MAG: Psd [Planctomycetota bacterium]|jgi:phosphatidylserine decarboxylase